MSTVDSNIVTGRRAGRGPRYLLIFILVLFAGTALWTWLALQWAYGDGTRSGVLQRFSRGGWVCKTWEGELAQYFGGFSPTIWHFSVRDAGVAAQIDKAVGARVQLHYTEHPGVPSACFGDTRYFVDRVTVTDPLPPLLPPAQPASPVPGPPSAAPPGTERGISPSVVPPSTPSTPPASPATPPASSGSPPSGA